MIRPSFVTDEIYHVYNRGVEKRNVFLQEKDYLRFIYGLNEFNSNLPATNFSFRLSKSDFDTKGERLVEIMCFCLMPNHYHLLLRQLVDNGVTEFMRKNGTGFTNYFNLNNKRVGALFQGKFKAIHVSKEDYLMYLIHYIHLNPLDLFIPGWKENGIKNVDKALGILNSYRWSSYLDYTEKDNFPFITRPDFILDNYYDSGKKSSKSNYQKEIIEWLKNPELDLLNDLVSKDY